MNEFTTFFCSFTLLWKCVRRASEAALKEITPHSHKAIKKPQRAIGMLGVRKKGLSECKLLCTLNSIISNLCSYLSQ